MDWDKYLQHLLFIYRTKPHESSGESPFFLLYGWDTRLPTESTLHSSTSLHMLDAADYRTELVMGLTTTWNMTCTSIAKAQSKQKFSMTKRLKLNHTKSVTELWYICLMKQQERIENPTMDLTVLLMHAITVYFCGLWISLTINRFLSTWTVYHHLADYSWLGPSIHNTRNMNTSTLLPCCWCQLNLLIINTALNQELNSKYEDVLLNKKGELEHRTCACIHMWLLYTRNNRESRDVVIWSVRKIFVYPVNPIILSTIRPLPTTGLHMHGICQIQDIQVIKIEVLQNTHFIL